MNGRHLSDFAIGFNLTGLAGDWNFGDSSWFFFVAVS
jgi:hypothetical protein